MRRKIAALVSMIALVGLVALASISLTEQRSKAAPAYQPQTREFLMVAGEWDTTLKKDVRDRGVARKTGDKLERYTFDPGFIAVYRGDTVVLKIHALKGDEHDVDIPAFGAHIDKKELQRGMEATVRFVANKSGLHRVFCTIHDEAYASKDRPEIGKKKGDLVGGPMVGHILVLDPPR
ncbi:MAG: hypothetical protein HY660_01680 [Armatimonadetes bacterium]|nr:hypothetical protein [Armatimonadota bacterium]